MDWAEADSEEGVETVEADSVVVADSVVADSVVDSVGWEEAVAGGLVP